MCKVNEKLTGLLGSKYQISSTKSAVQSPGESQKLMLSFADPELGGRGRSTLFSVFIYNTDATPECIFREFADHTKLGGAVNTWEGRLLFRGMGIEQTRINF